MSSMGTDGDLDIEMRAVVVVMVVVGMWIIFRDGRPESKSEHLSERVMAFPAVAFPSDINHHCEMSKPNRILMRDDPCPLAMKLY